MRVAASRHGVASFKRREKESPLRKIITSLAMLGFIALWIFLAATIGTQLTGMPQAVQLGFYVIAGVAWVFPLRPILRWMNQPRETDS